MRKIWARSRARYFVDAKNCNLCNGGIESRWPCNSDNFPSTSLNLSSSEFRSNFELEAGYDKSTVGPPSISVSLGLQFGSSDAIVDGNFGATAGVRNVGFETGSTINFDQQSFGVVISTSKAWGSVSGGVSVPVLKKKQ